MDYGKALAVTHELEKTFWWFDALRTYTSTLLDEVLPPDPARRVLDAGCGAGGNYPVLQRYGRVMAFDFTISALRLARTYGLDRVAQASITHIPFKANHFDLATSFDVLTVLDEEHQQQSLCELHRVLKPGGYLLLNLAAMMILWGKQDITWGVKRRYDRRHLRRQLRGAGFDVHRLSYTYAFAFPAVLAVRAADRYVFRSLDDAGTDGDLRPVPGPMNSLLAGMARLEARLLRHMSFPFGSSLMALARKPVAAA